MSVLLSNGYGLLVDWGGEGGILSLPSTMGSFHQALNLCQQLRDVSVCLCEW